MFKIGFDLQGGDGNVDNAIMGLKKFLRREDKDFKVVVYILDSFALDKEIKSKVEVIYASELIDHSDSILEIRRKKDSTLNRALLDLKDKKIDALISAGASGPLIAASYLTIKTFKENIRPAFAPTFIGFDKRMRMILDAGANSEVNEFQLNEFALMGSLYFSIVNKMENPKVALLNIGSEETKGTQTYKKAFQLLKQNEQINFVGNIESDELMNGDFDVLVSDGFNGNILIKSYEGAFRGIKALIKSHAQQSKKVKMGLLFAKSMYDDFESFTTDERLGGAIILGLNEYVLKVHGSADESQFFSAFMITKTALKNNLISKLKESL